MKLIIAGSRTITDKFEVVKAVSQALAEWQEREIVEIASGGAQGVDTIAEEFAEQFGVAFKEFPADWGKHGKKAGYLRNVQMADYADALVLVWDGKSRGSMIMKEVAIKKGLQIYEHIV